MKSPNHHLMVSFSKTLLQELGNECAVSVERDIATLDRRVHSEGVSFLTITMPALADWLLQVLETGSRELPVPASFKSFHSKALGMRLPSFLRGFAELALVSDPKTESDERTRAIRNFLQFTRGFAKITAHVPEHKHEAAIKQYIETDKEVTENDNVRSDGFVHRLSDVARRLFRHCLGRVDHSLGEGTNVPRHGPGSTADGLKGNQKYNLRTWSERLEAVSPAVDNLLPSYRYWQETEAVTWESPDQETPVKVITVPKTAKGPRVIAMEPTYVQYAQQGVKDLVYKAVRETEVGKFLEFEDQTRNQQHARRGSVSGLTATLDLSEASDRVSWKLVKEIFSSWPTFLEWLDATRSRKADVGDSVIELSKFASMGSALCFPVEAMVFLTIIIATIEERTGARYSSDESDVWAAYVSVYGDDLVVPALLADDVAARLGEAGLKVNRSKSFSKGKFRESCGHDYYDGQYVTSVRVRTMPPAHRSDVQEIVSWSSLRNQLYESGLWASAAWIDEHLTRLLRHYPIGYDQSASISRKSFLKDVPGRYDSRSCYTRNRGWKVVSKPPADPIDGTAALLKCLTSSSEDPGHLEHAGRPQAVNMKLGWVVAP